jgi:hypothetical protein|nr:MAG TPA: tail completion protein [Caudoviricetes sp.]
MISLNDIKNSLTVKLGSKLENINIFTEDIAQTKDINGLSVYPLLHIQLIPQNEVLEQGANAKYKTILVDITFMQESKSTNAAIYDCLDRLSDVIGTVIKVKDRFFTIQNINKMIADDLGHLLFNINFSDGIEVEEEVYEKMKELKLKL